MSASRAHIPPHILYPTSLHINILIMNSNTITSHTTTKIALGFFVTLALIAVPAFSQAATYAYVNQNGDVSSVVANDPLTAIAIAPNRAMHSGVILLDSQSDTDLLNDDVSGI
jgi:hypothetical protein